MRQCAIADIIRRDVPKPKILPIFYEGRLRFNIDGNMCCPMGLHPSATHCTPAIKTSFPLFGVTTKDVVSFANWWDNQSDYYLAVRELWGD